ncbi:terminal uridylyltransferase 4-like [Haemaphysalis longicornis]
MYGAQSPQRSFGLTASGMPRDDTDQRPIESAQKPGNRDRCGNAYAGTKHTAAGPKNCQVHEEGGGDAPRGDVRALVDRQPFTQQRLDTSPFHQERRRANSTSVPFGSSSTDRDQREAYHYRPSKVRLETLRQHHIRPLRKKSTLFPRAQFYCNLCQRHLDDVGYAEKHIQQDVHLTKKALSDLRMDVKNLPYPVKAQCDAISNFVQQIANEHGLTRGEVELRRRIAEDLEAHIKATLPDVRLTLHGSSVNGFGLKTSKVDIDLSTVGKADTVKLFIETGDMLLQCPKYSNVQTDFFFRVPRIRFTDVSSTLSCEISLNNNNSLKTSRLLEGYMSLDPRVQTLGVAFRFWANICGLDQQEKGTLPAHAFALMTVFFLQQCKPAVLPVLHELKRCDEPESYVKPKDLEGRWACKNFRSVGQLWVELLRFYAVEFKLSKHVVCIRNSQPVLITEKKWNNRYIAIEDPYSPKWNLARSIPSERVYLFVKGCLRSSAVYFLVPQLRSGPMFTMLPGLPHYKDDSDLESESDQEEDKLKGKKERQSQSPGCSVVTRANDGDDGEEEREDGAKSNDDKCLSFDENVNVVTIRHLVSNPATKPKGHKTTTPLLREQFVKPGPPIPQGILAKLDLCSMDDFQYSFTRETLACGKVPPIDCSFCQKSGHLREFCPGQRLPELKKLPDMTRNFEKILNNVCQDVMSACVLQPQEEADRQDVLHKLQSLIRESHKDAKLTLYGSSCNGFGLARCDLDICLTFNSSKDGKDISHVRMIKYLAKKFYKHSEFDEVIAITNAKVPIVKLLHVLSGLEVDISLYNRLAQQNTRLLKTYSSIDNRVRELGYTVKRFAKTCDICDASRGSLSSYAYILMALYYLQQRKPPVIPVLQELYPDGETKPEVIIEGWNAWFFEDIGRLQSVWSEFGQNKESVGELWLGMLRFYTEEFNFKKHVVCIRQKAPITKLQKMWNSRCIAIEDPFDLDHNLGIGVSPKMYIYIMKAFIKGRSLFGTPIGNLPATYATNVDYFFDSRKLTDGQRPNDRGCHRCGKIGHRVKECPKDWPSRQGVPATAGTRSQ